MKEKRSLFVSKSDYLQRFFFFLCRFTPVESFPWALSFIRNSEGACGWAYLGFTMLAVEIDKT